MKDFVTSVRHVVTRALLRPRSLLCLAVGALGIFLPPGWFLSWSFAWVIAYGCITLSSALDEDFILEEGKEEGRALLSEGERGQLGEKRKEGEEGKAAKSRLPLPPKQAERFRVLKGLAIAIHKELTEGPSHDGLDESRRRILLRLDGMVEAGRRLCALQARIDRRDPEGAGKRLIEEMDALRVKSMEAGDDAARKRWAQALQHKEESLKELKRLQGGAERIEAELDEVQGEVELISNRLASLSLRRPNQVFDEEGIQGQLAEIVDEVAVLEESLSSLEI